MNIQETRTPDLMKTYYKILDSLSNKTQDEFMEILETYKCYFFQSALRIELQDNLYLEVPYSEIQWTLFFTIFRIIKDILKNKQRVLLLYNLVNGYDLYKAPSIETYSIVQELPMEYVTKLNEIFQWFYNTDAYRNNYRENNDFYVDHGEFGFYFEYACDTTIEFPFDMSNLELLDKQILWFELMHKKALEISFVYKLT